MIYSIDSTDGEITHLPEANMNGNITTWPYGRGQYTILLNLPPNTTIEQFKTKCNELTTPNCCSTPQKAHTFYTQVCLELGFDDGSELQRKEKMIQIHCHTNLDLHPSEQWPKELPCRPNIGDTIQSLTPRKYGKLELTVTKITFTNTNLNIELHLPNHFTSIPEFTKWYNKFINL